MEVSQKMIKSMNETHDTVSAPSGFALKRGGKREDMVAVTDAERSLSLQKKLVRQLVFTEFGLSPVTSSPLSVKSQILPAKLSPELHLPPSCPLTVPKSESPVTLPQDSVKAKSGTHKGSKQCRCKRSKCLQLYCECFAIGAYCNGCSCSHCHNNIESEDLRQAAVAIILERNPYAFKPKIASSRCCPQDNGDDAEVTPLLGRHNRGCNCRRTECLKKYCECFRANVFCYENCKCTDCKNFEGYKEKMTFSAKYDSTKIYKNAQGCEGSIAISERDKGNVKICKNFDICPGRMSVSGESGQHSSDMKLYAQLVNTVISDAMGLSGHGLSRESRKRKVEELLSIEKDTTNQTLADYQQMNLLGVSCPLSGSAVDPVAPNNSFASLGSLRHPYRSLLAGLIHPDNSRELCSGLLLLAEAANVLADKVGKLDIQEAGENQKAGVIEAQNRENNHSDYNLTRRPAGANGERRRLPSGTLTLICNERGTVFMKATSAGEALRHGWDNASAEQERRVLASFKDCLEKLIVFTNKKAGAVVGGQFLQVRNPTIGV